jgi:hypothetical protein
MHLLPQYRPAIIFLVSNQIAISSLSPKVKGEAQSPECDEKGDEESARIQSPFMQQRVVIVEMPRIHYWNQRP